MLEKDMPKGKDAKKAAVIVTGTVEGDVHDIGKSIVSTMLQCAGYEVHDLRSRGRTHRQFHRHNKVEERSDGRPLGANDNFNAGSEGDYRDPTKEQGLRGKVKVMVGGAPASQAWADKIGADGYGENASEAVHKTNVLLAKSKSMG